MRTLRKLKVGLVGVMCTPFRGDKETQYALRSTDLESLSKEYGFELQVLPNGVYDLDQAQSAAAELQDWEADLILLQTSSFAPGELIYPLWDLPSRLGLWAVPEGPPSEEGGLPLNSFTATNMYNSIIGTIKQDHHRPVKWFYGSPGQEFFDERLKITIQALTAEVNVRGATVGLIGGVAPGFHNLIIDDAKLFERLGVHVIAVELGDVIRKAKAYAEDQVRPVRETIRSATKFFDETQVAALDKTGRVVLALQDLADRLSLSALAISCWPRFQEDYHLAVCGVIAQLNEMGTVAACEGDVTSAVSMLTLKALSSDTTTTLMDLSAIDEEDQSILLWHCGPTAPSLADEQGVQMGSLWLFDGYEGDPIGLSNDMVLKAGRATVMGYSTDFDHMLVLDGVFDPEKPSYRGSRGWMKSLRLNGQELIVRDLVETLMNANFQHHYPVAYGDLTDVALELGAWLGIQPIERKPYSPRLTWQSEIS